MRLQRVMLHHDKDSIFTGHGWTARLLLMDRVRVSYALNSARDSPEMEVFNSRFETTNRLASTHELRRYSAPIAVASQFRGSETVQEMGCPPERHNVNFGILTQDTSDEIAANEPGPSCD